MSGCKYKMVKEFDQAVRNNEEDPIESMRKYVRVLRRVNRVYLAECKRPNKNKRLADKLGDKLEGAFKRANPSEE